MFFAETMMPRDPRVSVETDAANLVYWEKLLLDCASRGLVSGDTETSGFDWFRNARAIGHCWGYDLGDGHGPRGLYLPMRHQTPDRQLPVDGVLSIARKVLGNPAHQVVGHFTKFDWHMWAVDGIDVKATMHDLHFMGCLVDENKDKQLETIISDYQLDPAPYFYKEKVGEVFGFECKRRGVGKKKAPGYAWVPVPVCGPYGATDARFTLLGAYRLLPLVQQHWWRIYCTELAILPIVQRAEAEGLPINVDYLHTLHERLERDGERLLTKIQELAGFDLNPGSDDQVRELIYGRMRQPVNYWTDNIKHDGYGNEIRTPAVNALALKDILHRGPSPLIEALLEYREVTKLASTYTLPIIEHTDSRGFLHGRLNQFGARTGRFSSDDPNLQNMPSEDELTPIEERYSIRRAFEVEPGEVSLYLDFSQIELRVLAFLSGEPTMFGAFLKGEDVHAATSLRMFGKADKSNRRVAKVINFGVAYGMTKHGIRDNLNKTADPAKGIPTVTIEEADAHLSHWHRLFSRVAAFTDEEVARAVQHRPPAFTNMFGRTRRIPELLAFGSAGRRAVRQLIASKVQGTAAELIKEVIVRVGVITDRARAEGRYNARFKLTVHDEVRVDVNREGAYACAVEVKAAMEDFPQFAPMPIVAEAEWTSTHWAAKEPIWKKPK